MLNQHWVEFLFDRFGRLFAAFRSMPGGAPALGLLVSIAIVAAVNYAPQFEDAGMQVASLPELTEPGNVPASAGVMHVGGVAGATHAAAAMAVRSIPSQSSEQQNIARFIARRYQLAIEQTQEFVEYAYRTAREAKLDPWLILAVISVESAFDPEAQSHRGAQGLMQVLTRVHADKFAPFGGVSAAFDPLANIKVGAQILKSYLARDGSVEGALKAYTGAALMPHDGGYGAKVLNERERIAAAASGRPEMIKAALVAVQSSKTDTAGAPSDGPLRRVDGGRDDASQGAGRRSPDTGHGAPVEFEPVRLDERASLDLPAAQANSRGI